jgi:biopolymer transport protein TolR
MRSRKTINQINVVPYIDVMLVLLVIFMVTAPLITPGEIELPTVGSKPAVPVAPLTVRVARNGDLSFRDMQTGGTYAKTNIDDIVARVTRKQGGSTQAQAVVIEADRGVRYDDVVKVLDALQRGGAQKVGLMVQPPKQ